jgi:hypothetical protein
MARCDVCGNDYAASFEILTAKGQRFTFDSFECAIDKLAPTCAHCGCRVVGHGIESSHAIYCCAHCARESGARSAVDNTTRSGTAKASAVHKA